ncbi:MAG TPA: enolase C-terminal domain-like protein [Acidimicrobiales bacterium]|jgi:O-succinylbenzoate synthase|nr:enolase C-terminal domain-like protein [Acidimicrobiales bacterium]
MKLAGIELIRLDVPFSQPVGTAAGVHRQRQLLFARVVGDEGEGWGECAALAEGTAVDPTLAQVDEAAAGRGVRRLIDASAARDGELPMQTDVAQLFGSSPIDRQLGALFEMAVADLELRQSGDSLGSSLGLNPGFETLPVGAAVGIPQGHDMGEFRQSVTAAVEAGAARLRLKIEPGWDVGPVEAARTDHPDLVLQVDANGAYDLEDADHLATLGDFNVLCIEQPLPPADLVAHAALARRLPYAICLDESLSSPRRVLDAIRYDACRVACLKPGRLGGLRAARLAHAACMEAGVSVFVGGFFEAGLGRASNLALAARLSQDTVGLVGDLSDPASYLAVDPCGYPAVERGWVRVPTDPGVGRWPRASVLSEFAALRRWFPATYT